MDDLTAKNQIEAFFYEVLENFLPGGIGGIEKLHSDPDAWEAEISECNSYLYVLQKSEPDPHPVSEISLQHPENVPMGEYYMLLDFDPDAIGEEATISMLQGIKHLQVYVRFAEDNIPLTPAEAIEVMKDR
jgi:hypothetical protein